MTKSPNILKNIKFKNILVITICKCRLWLYDLFNGDRVNIICLQWMKAAHNTAADKQKGRLFFIYLWHTPNLTLFVCILSMCVCLCMRVLQGADSHWGSFTFEPEVKSQLWGSSGEAHSWSGVPENLFGMWLSMCMCECMRENSYGSGPRPCI